ncbi:MAG TPA: leucine--tRNA ligase [Nitrososphaeraceae archaeon]|jgi:leucyl-tRNA synthetase|nr:leucine--tRNA ligase [Nitrososphaeraceae archaeon]
MINTNNQYNHNIEWSLIEEKWRHKWDEQQIFNSDPDFSKKKYFITVAYPYPNSPQHIGHGRTYTLADAHARYMRMKGYNVLFPMGFHYTGTPILAMSRRIASGDKELLETFQYIYHVSEDVVKSFVEPIKIASYFHNEIKLGMKEMGYSIDWRREFTTIDKLYSKFISWQFNTLRKKGLIVQGSHPVGWCPKDQNPVSQHDTIGDVEPDFNEYILIKFKLDDGYIIPTATLRPETIYGVTNLWVNPNVEYVRIQIDNNERWIVSKEAARKLEFLNHKVSIKSSIYGKEIVGKYVEAPIRKVSIPLYPASFVESDNGTGIVMSVPGHAPYDFQAIEDLKKNISLHNEFVSLKIDVTPITIIGSDDYYYADVNDSILISPAAKIINEFKVKDQEDPQLEKATNELYSHEYYKGKMLQNTGKYVGMPVSVAKDMIKNEIVSNGVAEIMFELINKPVRCRCGTECVVKILNDQWFINYGDKNWKKLAHECLNKMDIVPEEIRQEFNYVIDWLRERACARKSGLGTKLPLDEDWIIESLSDSVIYMSYYIVAKYVNHTNNNSISDGSSKLIINLNNVDALNDSFFDYIFLGNGDVRQIAAECNVSISLIESIRNEFSYFYPLDARHSGRDLVQNHLSFFIFNHVAIFTRENWPRKIVVNGSVLMEGKKMSKSLGNIIPLRAAIKEHSADVIRLAMLSSAELLQDADFSFEAIKGIRSKLDDIYHMAIEYSMVKSKFGSSLFSSIILSEANTEIEDRWLLSRLQNHITDITVSMDKLRVRKALHDILYLLDQDLQWYRKRITAKHRDDSLIALTLTIFLDNRIRMLAPFAPFISEEVWEIIGGKYDSIIFAGWPIVDEDKKDPIAEESEQLIINLISDLQNILRVTKISPTKIIIYTSAQWKQEIYQKILEYILLENKTNFGDIMKQLVKDPETAKAKNDPKLIRNMIDDILSDPIEARNRRLKLTVFDEKFPLNDAKKLLSIESGNAQAEIIVHSEDDIQKYDPREKSKYSRPFKPAIYIE